MNLGHFFEISDDFMCVTDIEGQILQVNKAFSEFFIEPNILGNQNILDFVCDEDMEDTKLQMEQKNSDFVNRCVNTADQLHDIQWKTNIIGDSVYFIGRDITDPVKTKNELAALEKELEMQYLEQESLCSKISHNFKNAIFSIHGFIELLKYNIAVENWEAAKEDIKFAEKSLSQTNDTINNLAATKKFQIQCFSLLTIIEAAVERCWQIQKTKIQIKIPENEIFFTCYQDFMMEAIHNILENAIKYTPVGVVPQITIDLKESDRDIICSIKDNGIGIAEKYHTKIFELFWQLDRKTPGNGVGLAVSKGIIERNNGKIWCESSCQGTTFYIRFIKKD